MRNVPPREFPTVNELNATEGILNLLKEDIPEFIKSIIEGDKLNEEIMSAKLKPEDMNKKRGEFFKSSKELEIEIGNDLLEIGFEDDIFNMFFQQVERWGRMWFPTLDKYFEFRKSMCVTNSQLKKK